MPEQQQQPPPPPPEMAPMSPLPVATAPRASDDMTGSVGFGIGIGSSSQLLSSNFAGTNNQVALRYWTSDTLALQPAVNFTLAKGEGVDATWGLNPEFVALFVPLRGASTRMLVGGGLGITLNKVPMNDTAFTFYLPVQAGVEHFLARWFSLGLAARSNFFAMATGTPWSIAMNLNSMAFLGSAFIYTD
jgi:hypothetical protein